MFAFWERWRYDQRTIADGGFDRTFKEVAAAAKKNPVAVMDAFETYLREVADARSGAGLEFADLDAEQRRATQDVRKAERQRDRDAEDRMKKYAQAD